MIAARAVAGTTLLAFDEFQCLDLDLLPIAIRDWLPARCQATVLNGCRRTNENSLIAAAKAVRDGRALTLNAGSFRAVAAPGIPLAAWNVANAIARRGQGNVAVLTPSRTGHFSDRIVARVVQGSIGKRPIGPYPIAWESNDRQEIVETWNGLGLVDGMSIDAAMQCLAARRHLPVADAMRKRLLHRRSVAGAEAMSADEMSRYLSRLLAARRHHGSRRAPPFAAMTIQQAKNREFDHVVVIWPYTVRDDPEQKRRLLYNAITRAKRSCLVLVQSASMLRASPFA